MSRMREAKTLSCAQPFSQLLPLGRQFGERFISFSFAHDNQHHPNKWIHSLKLTAKAPENMSKPMGNSIFQALSFRG